MALTNAEKQARWRERLKQQAAQAIAAGDTDKQIVRKIVDAIGMDRARVLATTLPKLIAAENRRRRPKSAIILQWETTSRGDNPRMALHQAKFKSGRYTIYNTEPIHGDNIDWFVARWWPKPKSGYFKVLYGDRSLADAKAACEKHAAR